MHEYEVRYEKDIFIGFQWSFADPILDLKRDLLCGVYGRALSGKAIVLWNRDVNYYNRGTGWAGKIKSEDGVYIYDSVASNARVTANDKMKIIAEEKMQIIAREEVDMLDSFC